MATIGATTQYFGRPTTAAFAADGNLADTLSQIKNAREQLDDIPALIDAEKWDAGKCITYYIHVFFINDIPQSRLCILLWILQLTHNMT